MIGQMSSKNFLSRAIKNDFDKVLIIGKYKNGDVYVDGDPMSPEELLELLQEAGDKLGIKLNAHKSG
jgi:hypothetical protein